VPALGGELHWIVTPVDPAGRPPTYGPSSNVLLHFVPAGPAAGTTPGRLPRLRLSARPHRLVAGRRTRGRFRGWTVVAGRRVPAVGARIRVARRQAFAGPRGGARVTLRPHAAGRLHPRASRSAARAARITLRVARRHARF
jgi:hypothetical protein